MKNLKITLTVLLLSAVFNTSFSQDKPLEALKKMEGNWTGEGWVKIPNGTTQTFNQKETIEYKLNESILVINGRGYHQKTNEKTFEAFAIMYKDMDGTIKMSSHTMEGKHVVATVESNENGYNWWFKTPNGGKIIYEITIKDNIWAEKGSYSPDGNQSFPFMEMTLTKDTE